MTRGIIYRRAVSDDQLKALQATNSTLIDSLFNRAFTDPAIRDVLLSQDRQNYCMGGACCAAADSKVPRATHTICDHL